MPLLSGATSFIGGLGGPVSNWIGGKEEGYGTARPGTLEFYIDKLRGVSDAKAFAIKEVIIEAKLAGATDEEIKDILRAESQEVNLGPEEYGPILRKLREEVATVENQQAKQQQQQQAAATSVSDLGSFGGSIAGFNPMTFLLILIIGGGFYFAQQQKK